jgi:hypothetical protein
MIALVQLAQLKFDADDYVRDAMDLTRVQIFVGIMEESDILPPIIVVPRPDGLFLIADGMHRCLAAQKLELIHITADVVMPMTNETPEQCAHRLALEYSAHSALPLTRAERHRAVLRLLETRPELSHRQIASMVGVAHSSVNRWALDVEVSTVEGDHPNLQIGPNPDRVAGRLVRMLDQLAESRGVLDYLAPRRMGRHLAGAFNDHYGDRAVHEARNFEAWVTAAIQHLKEGGH